MMKRFLLFLPLLCCLQMYAGDIEIVKQQISESALLSNPQLAKELTSFPQEKFGDQVAVELYQDYPISKDEIEALLATLNADGSWTDLGYKDVVGEDGEVRLDHVNRILTLCIAYLQPSSPYYINTQVKNAISRSLDNWLARGFEVKERTKRGVLKRNFWYNDIGIPRVLGKVLILFDKHLTEDQRTAGMKALEHVRIYGQGQNKIWLAGNVLIHGLLTGNEHEITAARDSIISEVTCGEKAEGIQTDQSYLMHGPQQQFGNYGAIFIGDMSLWVTALCNTKWAFPQQKLDIIADYAEDGLGQVLYKGMLDVNGLGRQQFRYSQRYKGLYIIMSAYRLSMADAQNRSRYERMVKSNLGNAQARLGIYHFEKADQTVAHQPQWMTSVRMSSKWTLGGEAGNGDNMKGYYMSDGATYTYVDGDEYENIQPLWDWHRLPGITAYDTTTPLQVLNFSGYRSQSSYVGHVGNGKIGLTTMNLVRDKLDALKSWVITDKYVFCLGAGITSPQDSAVVTSIDQLHRKSELLHLTEKGWQPITDYSTRNLQSQTAERFFHGKTGYIALNGKCLIAKDEERSGSWHDIMNDYPQDMTATGRIVSLWFDHGYKPQNEAYAYIVLPATTKKEVSAFSLKDIQILRNDRQMQAVHLLKEKVILMSVFQVSDIKLPYDIPFHPSETGLYLIDYSKDKHNPSIVCHSMQDEVTDEPIAIPMDSPISIAAAQSGNGFEGKWQFIVTGSSQGNSVIIISLIRGEDGKLTGELSRDGSPAVKLDRVEEEAGKSFTAYFKTNGYDCYLFAELAGENEMKGSLMDMFDCTGKRIEE